jgi:hypothetical protein
LKEKEKLRCAEKIINQKTRLHNKEAMAVTYRTNVSTPFTKIDTILEEKINWQTN